VASEKLNRLKDLLREYGSCVVAYSGGVDSVFLARVAQEVLGEKSLAVIADSASLPRRELAEALALGRQFDFPVRVIKTQEFANAEYLANPMNRCYFCKHELFTELVPMARAGGFAVIAYGENASDVADFRPGAKAAAEFQVRAPLKEAGLTKVEIRKFSAAMGLPTADKPQMACLSSRIPHGEAVSAEKLRMIEEAEYVLRDLGFYDVRVRHREVRSAECGVRNEEQKGIANSQSSIAEGHWARIEVGATELPRLLEEGMKARVTEALRGIGYAEVTVDLQGYRRGVAENGVKRAVSG
jgi:uncharacterized protein